MILRKTLPILGLLLLILSLSACTKVTESKTLYPEAARSGNVQGTFHFDETLDGWGISNNTAWLHVGGTYEPEASTPHKDCTKSYLSFDLTSLPAGARVQSATLRVYLADWDNDPTVLGPVIAEHIYFGAANPLEHVADVFGGYLFAPQIDGSLVSTMSLGRKEIDVTSAVKADVSAHHGWTQFRLRHTELFMTSGTYCSVDWNGPTAASDKPQLFITYTFYAD